METRARVEAASTAKIPDHRTFWMPSPEPMRDGCRQSLALEVLREHGEIRISVLGLSMLPTFWPADVLTIRAASLDECAPGDVVLCESKQRFVIHRVVRSLGDRLLITRGDALFHADHPVAENQLRGRVVDVQRRGRRSFVGPLSRTARLIGLILGHSTRLRSLALRMYCRNSASSRMDSLRSVHGSV